MLIRQTSKQSGGYKSILAYTYDRQCLLVHQNSCSNHTTAVHAKYNKTNEFAYTPNLLYLWHNTFLTNWQTTCLPSIKHCIQTDDLFPADIMTVLPLLNSKATSFLYCTRQFLQKLLVRFVRRNINTVEAETQHRDVLMYCICNSTTQDHLPFTVTIC